MNPERGRLGYPESGPEPISDNDCNGRPVNRATLGASRRALKLLRVRGAGELARHAVRCAGSLLAVVGALLLGHVQHDAQIASLNHKVDELLQERDDLWAANVELRSGLAAVIAEQDALQARVDALVAELRGPGRAA